MKNPVTLAKRHPAETAGPLAIAVAVLIAAAFGLENRTTIAALAIVLSFVPAAVTWIVDARKTP